MIMDAFPRMLFHGVGTVSWLPPGWGRSIRSWKTTAEKLYLIHMIDETGWNPPGALSTALSGRESVPLAATAQTRSRRRTQTATGARRLLGKQTATSRFPGCAGTIPAVEGRAHRPHPHYRHAGRMKLDRRAKPARRSSRFQMQSLRSGVPPAAHPIPNRKALRATSVAWEGLRRLLPEPTPSPRLCINRKGATPFGLSHSNRPSHKGPSQPDISTWLTTGHFYLALTVSDPNRSGHSRSFGRWEHCCIPCRPQ